MPLRVLVAGAAGQLGQVLVRDLKRTHEVFALTRSSLDLLDRANVPARVAKYRPEVIVNCAAFNDVDGAEDDARAALDINAFAVQSLAEAAIACDAVLVHFGSDFVFDGTASKPYTEEDWPNPRSVYGASKLLGEMFAVRAPKHYVLRVESLFGGPGGRSSVDKMAADISAGRPVRAFYDRTVSPSFVDHVSAATRRLIERSLPFGLYHCVNSGFTNWYELALELARRLKKESAAIVPVSADGVALKAPRPRFCALSNARLASIGIEMPTWQMAVEHYAASRGKSGLTPIP